jgi:hypothetical protein
MSKIVAKRGDIIVFDRPVEFLDGNILKELRLEERSKFRDPITGKGYSVTSWRRFAYSIKREGKLLGRPDSLADLRILCTTCNRQTKYDALDVVTGKPCDKCGELL